MAVLFARFMICFLNIMITLIDKGNVRSSEHYHKKCRKNHATNNNNNNSNNNAGKYHLTGRGQKIRTRPHSIQMDTAGHMVIVYISIIEMQTESTRRRDTQRKQLVQTQWEGRIRTYIGSKDYADSYQRRKNQKRLILSTI